MPLFLLLPCNYRTRPFHVNPNSQLLACLRRDPGQGAEQLVDVAWAADAPRAPSAWFRLLVIAGVNPSGGARAPQRVPAALTGGRNISANEHTRPRKAVARGFSEKATFIEVLRVPAWNRLAAFAALRAVQVPAPPPNFPKSAEWSEAGGASRDGTGGPAGRTIYRDGNGR